MFQLSTLQPSSGSIAFIQMVAAGVQFLNS